MTIQDLLKDVSVMDLTAFARAIPSPKDFLLTQTIFPTVEMREVKWRTKDSGRYVNVAKYRAFNASVPFATREAWQTSREGALPALGQKLVVSEQEQILLEASHGSDQDRLIELLYDDVERHVEAIRSRLELAAGDVLVDGRFTLEQENGLTLEVDWNVPAENMPVARIPWSDPASDPIADELRWIQHLDDIGAPEPELVITSRKAFSYLAANNAYRAAYYGSVNPSTTPTATLTPQQINVVRGNYNLPPIQFYKAQVRVDGKPRKVLPEDLWILVPPEREKWAQTMYGVTAEALVLSRGMNPEIIREDAPGLIITRGVQDDPVQIWTKPRLACRSCTPRTRTSWRRSCDGGPRAAEGRGLRTGPDHTGGADPAAGREPRPGGGRADQQPGRLGRPDAGRRRSGADRYRRAGPDCRQRRAGLGTGRGRRGRHEEVGVAADSLVLCVTRSQRTARSRFPHPAPGRASY